MSEYLPGPQLPEPHLPEPRRPHWAADVDGARSPLRLLDGPRAYGLGLDELVDLLDDAAAPATELELRGERAALAAFRRGQAIRCAVPATQIATDRPAARRRAGSGHVVTLTGRRPAARRAAPRPPVSVVGPVLTIATSAAVAAMVYTITLSLTATIPSVGRPDTAAVPTGWGPQGGTAASSSQSGANQARSGTAGRSTMVRARPVTTVIPAGAPAGAEAAGVTGDPAASPGPQLASPYGSGGHSLGGGPTSTSPSPGDDGPGSRSPSATSDPTTHGATPQGPAPEGVPGADPASGSADTPLGGSGSGGSGSGGSGAGGSGGTPGEVWAPVTAIPVQPVEAALPDSMRGRCVAWRAGNQSKGEKKGFDDLTEGRDPALVDQLCAELLERTR